MYSLIALGFVLATATDAINFAQGEFVMLAGMIVVTVLGFEGAADRRHRCRSAGNDRLRLRSGKVVLRPLLGRPVVAVIMATMGPPPCAGWAR
jgi:branched-chain amino acid transport system permease protein